MTPLLAAFIAQTWPYLLAGIAGLAGLLTAYSKGQAREKAKQAQADAAARTEGQKIDDAVAGRTPDDNRGRLSKWSKS
jgi:hypothetical protein